MSHSKMIITTLHNFDLVSEKAYVFSCQNYKIRKLIPELDVIDIDLFSKQDLNYIKNTIWVIETNKRNSLNISEEINLILIAIKIFFRKSTYAKYRICKDNILKCRRLTEAQSFTDTESYEPLEYSDLGKIDYGFECLKEMRSISNRTYNALYFLYRGFYSYQWRDSYIFLICVIESLFSKNTAGGNTNKICKRVSRFIDDINYNEDKIRNIYNLRSDLIHGRITLDDKSENNIKKVSELEDLVIRIVEKILNEKIYLHYQSDENRSKYLGNLATKKA